MVALVRRRSKFAALTAGAVLAVGAVMAPAAAAPTVPAPTGDSPTLKGLVLTGACPPDSTLKQVTLTPKLDYLWAPLRFADTKFQPLTKWIFPAKIVVTGNGLKSRHLAGGETYSRPWPSLSRSPATCSLEGSTTADGYFHVEITGTVLGWGSAPTG